jgi:3-oxoacyl-[acyl-carrier protein] reductase
MDLKLKNKKALVLASSSGLGKASALELTKEGAEVIISSSNEDNLIRTKEEIGAFDYIVANYQEKGAGAKLVHEAKDKLGGIDILVTNAGGPKKGTFDKLNDENWEVAFQSLFMMLVQTIREATPVMEKNNFGRIVMITSIAGKEPIKGLTISNALRAGVHGLMNTLSKELGGKGITVNAVLPTFTDTERLRELGRTTAEMTEKIPAGRLGKPDELGKLIAFLSSEHAGFINGQAIGFDGGSMQGI